MVQLYTRLGLGVILFLLHFLPQYSTRLDAQCSCTDCPVILPHAGANNAHLTVAGATNNVLDGVNQFVKVVHIDVLHDALRECEIRLIAPDGSSVLLSDNVGVNVGNNITYNICFVNCTEAAMPDPGFPANFNAAAGYMHDQTYYGTYYPFNGACLSTLTGPVNGQWTLAFNDFVGGDGGEILDWSIEFNDSSGTGCSVNCDPPPPICGAVEDTLVIPPVSGFCLGSPDLQFSITSFYDPPLADPSLYGYVFILTDLETGSTIEYNTDQDFTDLPKGTYQLCGITYLLADAALLPPLDGSDLYNVIKDMIANGIICASVSRDCFIFTVEEPPLPFQLVGPTQIQAGDEGIYTILNFEPDVTTTVFIEDGCYTNLQVLDDIIKITWLGGPGRICVTKLNSCATETSCVDVNVIVDPLEFIIEGPDEICGGEITNYTVSPSINTDDFDYEWTVTNGTITNQSNTGLTVSWNLDGMGEICLNLTDFCGGEHEFCYSVTLLNIMADPPSMSSLPVTVCVGTELETNLTVSPGYLNLVWSITGGNILAGQGSEDLTFTTNQAGLVTVCADVEYECDIEFQVCNSVEYVVRPNPVIQWLQSCGLFAEVRITNPTNGAVFLWEQVSGPGQITFQQAMDSRTMFTADLPGTYTISITEAIGECSGFKNLTFTLKPDLMIENLEIDCSNINGYTVSFMITGGATPYFVNANQITGSTFTSALIPHNQDYNFLLQDNESCQLVIAGTSKCDCFTDAGTSGENLITVCEGEKAIGEPVTDAVLDPDDIGLYILQSSGSNILGIIYQTNTSPEFEFMPPLEYGKIYYISYLVGNDFGGMVDLTDPCLSVSMGQPFMFLQKPNPIVVAPPPTCGLEINLPFVPEPNVSYTLTASDPGIVVDSVSPGEFKVKANTFGNYTLILSGSNQGCTGQTTFNLLFLAPPSAVAGDFICSNDLLSYSTLLTLQGNAPFVISGGMATQVDDLHVQVENLVSSSATELLITDNFGCTSTISVSYNCLCQSTPGTMASQEIKACGDEVIQGVYLMNGNPGNVDSFIYILHTLPGNVLGQVLETSSDGTFFKTPNLSYNTTYYISYVTVNFVNGQFQIEPCSFVAPGQPVTFLEKPSLTWNIQEALCSPEALFTFTSAFNIQDPVVIDFPVGATINSLDITGFTADKPGVYTFSVEVDNQGCSASFENNVRVYNSPIIKNIVPRCSGLFFETSFEIMDGTMPYFLNGTQEISSPFTSQLITSGDIFSFYVEDSRGCKTMVEETTLVCNCTVDVGSLNGSEFILCPEAPLNPLFEDNYTLDTGYEIRYILHDGNSVNIGTIYWQGNTFPLPYQPTWAGKNLVITRIIGPVLPDGSIDVTDACFGISNSLPVFWNEKPGITIQVLPYYCEGSDISISFENVPTGTLSFTDINGQTIEVLQGLTEIIIPSTNVQSGDILQWQFVDEAGCQFTLENTTLTIEPLPEAGSSGRSFGACVDVVQAINLPDYVDGEDPGGLWYLGGFSNPVMAEYTVGANITRDTTMYYIVQNVCGADTSSVEIERWPNPEFDLDGINPLCNGTENGVIEILPQGNSQDWTIYVNNSLITAFELQDLPSGEYQVRIENSFECATEMAITLEEPQPIELDLGGDITILEGDLLTLQLNTNIAANEISNIRWIMPWGEIINGSQISINVLPVSEGIIQAFITDLNGCTAQDEIVLRIEKKKVEIVIVIPNIIKSGQGPNSKFYLPDVKNIAAVQSCRIYDRWGNLVYNADNQRPELLVWEGTFRGDLVEQGVYVYTMVLALTDGTIQTFQGDITVLR